jgi:hypothetical protein
MEFRYCPNAPRRGLSPLSPLLSWWGWHLANRYDASQDSFLHIKFGVLPCACVALLYNLVRYDELFFFAPRLAAHHTAADPAPSYANRACTRERKTRREKKNLVPRSMRFEPKALFRTTSLPPSHGFTKLIFSFFVWPATAQL